MQENSCISPRANFMWVAILLTSKFLYSYIFVEMILIFAYFIDYLIIIYLVRRIYFSCCYEKSSIALKTLLFLRASPEKLGSGDTAVGMTSYCPHS